MKRLAALLYFACYFFGCAQPEMKPRECIVNVADAQMRALAQGVLLCREETACIEREIEQRELILAGYVEDLCGDKEND